MSLTKLFAETTTNTSLESFFLFRIGAYFSRTVFPAKFRWSISFVNLFYWKYFVFTIFVLSMKATSSAGALSDRLASLYIISLTRKLTDLGIPWFNELTNPGPDRWSV